MFGIREDILTDRYPGKTIDDFPWEKYQKYKLAELKELPWPKTDPYKEGSATECPSGIPDNMTVEYWFRKNDVENHPNGQGLLYP